VFLGLKVPHVGVKDQLRFPDPSAVNGDITVDPFTAGSMYRVTVRPAVKPLPVTQNVSPS
jgi:hypothetical protein